MTPKQHLVKLWRDQRPERFKDDKPPKWTDANANGLTKMIVQFINISGFQAERISSTGRYVDNRKVVTDVLGRKREIGSGQWIKGSSTKGTADISAIIRSNKGVVIPWKIEVKIGKDKQSEFQKKYEEDIKRSGGHYSIVKDFNDFYNQYFKLINNETD